jgi:hypothetical protein
MRKKITKRSLFLAIVAVLALSAGALAYWTTTGAGGGTGTVAASGGTLTLTASIDTPANMYPGGSSNVTYTATNPGSTSLRVAAVTTTVDAAAAGCADGDFDVTSATQNVTVAPGATVTLPTKGVLSFANDATNSQDACKGTGLTLTSSSN